MWVSRYCCGRGSTREEAAPHPQAAPDLVREHRKEPHTFRRTQVVPGLAGGPCKEGQGGSCPSPSGRACLGGGALQGAAYPPSNTGSSWFGGGALQGGAGWVMSPQGGAGVDMSRGRMLVTGAPTDTHGLGPQVLGVAQYTTAGSDTHGTQHWLGHVGVGAPERSDGGCKCRGHAHCSLTVRQHIMMVGTPRLHAAAARRRATGPGMILACSTCPATVPVTDPRWFTRAGDAPQVAASCSFFFFTRRPARLTLWQSESASLSGAAVSLGAVAGPVQC
jgi:hypothetical protein